MEEEERKKTQQNDKRQQVLKVAGAHGPTICPSVSRLGSLFIQPLQDLPACAPVSLSWNGNALTGAPVADDDFLGLAAGDVSTQAAATARPPADARAATAQGHVRVHQLTEEVDVADGQAQRVHFGEALLVGQRGDVRAQPLEGIVDGLHASPLPHISRLSQLLQLGLRAHPPPPSRRRRRPAQAAQPGPWGQHRHPGARVGQARGWRVGRVGEAARGRPRLTAVAAATLVWLSKAPRGRRSERVRARRGRGLQQQARPVAVVVFVQLVAEELHLSLLVHQQLIAILQRVPRGLVCEEVLLVEVGRREGVQAPGEVL